MHEHDPQTLQDHDCIGNNTTNPIISFKYSDHHQDDLQFRPNPCQNSMESDHSGANSPPLWKNASPSPSKSPTQPLLSHQYYNSHRSLSPDSRTQAIVRGQRELMEMVRNMPESSYELSLKDLVENNRLENQEPPQGISRLSNVDGQNHHLHRRGGNVKRQESKRYEVRKGGLENKGLFLNVVSPFFSLKSKKKKKKKIVGGGVSGGVSPKPEVAKSLGGGEKDWWKKKLSGSTDSDSSRASNNFGSSIGSSSGGSSSSTRSYSNSRKRNGCVAGCWPFLRSRKSRSAE